MYEQLFFTSKCLSGAIIITIIIIIIVIIIIAIIIFFPFMKIRISRHWNKDNIFLYIHIIFFSNAVCRLELDFNKQNQLAYR